MEPRKHHYIPKFLLKRWAGTDGRLTEFSRPFGSTIKPRRVFPSMTGYVDRLYELRGFPPDDAQQIELKFMQPIDSQASEALTLLENGVPKDELSDLHVSAWSRFLISLLVRMPEDIAGMRSFWQELSLRATPEEERQYTLARRDGDPKTFVDFLKLQPIAYQEQGAFSAMIRAHNSTEIGQHLNNMFWKIVDLNNSTHELFLTDRPIIRSTNLKHPKGHIALPISPSLLFVATEQEDVMQLLCSTAPSVIVSECNSIVVGAAKKYCYASTDKNIKFVSNRMGSNFQDRLVDKLRSDAYFNSKP